MGSNLPSGAQTIDSYEDLLTAFTQIDQRLHRICAGDLPPYIYRNKLYLPASMFAIHMAAIGSGGERVTLGGATAQLPVTEASAAGISIATQVARNNIGWIAPPTVAATSGTLSVQDHHQMKVVPIATDGSGAAAATELVGTVAGYYPVIDRVLVWCATADAATTLTFSSGGGGALVGVPAPIIVLVAATTCEMLDGLIWYNLTDATTLSVAIAGAPATNTVYFVVEYHYET